MSELGANFNTSKALQLLFTKALPQLSMADLVDLRDGAADEAVCLAAHAAAVAEGLSHLVAADADLADRGMPGRSLQSAHDAPDLLAHLAGVFRHVEALVSLAGLATYEASREGGAS